MQRVAGGTSAIWRILYARREFAKTTYAGGGYRVAGALIGQHFGLKPRVVKQVDEDGGLDPSRDRFHPQDPVAVFEVKICFVFPEGMVDLIDQPIGVIGVGHVGFEHFYHWNKTIANG